MIAFLLIVYFYGTKNYQSIFLFLNSVSNIQYTIYIHTYIYIYIYIYMHPSIPHPTREGIETMRQCVNIQKLVLINLASIILKNDYFEKGQLEHHQKIGFAVGTEFAPPYSNLFMTGLEKKRFFKTASLNLSCAYDTLMRFLIYEPKAPRI